MPFLEVEYSKNIFFECYKINENIQSVGWFVELHWLCVFGMSRNSKFY